VLANDVRDQTAEEATMPVSERARKRSQVDWLISNLRWLLLVSVGLVSLVDIFIKTGGVIDPRSILPLTVIWGLAIVYNLTMTFMLLSGAFPRAFPAVTLAIDTALTIGFVAASGGLDSPLLFFALFPILTAALRYPWVFSLLVAIVIVTGCGLAGYRIAPPGTPVTDLFPFAARALILLLAALISGLAGDRLTRAVARSIRLEEEVELRNLRAGHERARVVFELASTLSATLNYSTVLQTMLEVGEAGMRDLGQPDTSHVSIVLLFSRDGLRVVASRHLPQRDQRAVFRGEQGVLAQALARAEPVITDDPVSDPELSQLIMMHSCQQAVVVPLRAGFENFGAVVFGSTRQGTYTEDHLDLLLAICNQAVVALQNAQLYQSLMREKEHIVAVEEDARKKLARDLHDGPTQSIASIAMRINYIRTLLHQNPDTVPGELAQVEEMARRTTKEIRHMLFTLRPLILETQGLCAALDAYISKLSETDSTTVHLEAAPGVDQVVSKNAQGVIFYIMEEAISNARKHARAQNIWIRLGVENESFVTEVEDDGIGFDIAAVEAGYDERGSLGMVNMHERTDLINGKLAIRSTPGNGTRVRLNVPLQGR
jgi:signal transduction histidine kinase